MPTIKANEKQLSALKDIENALKIVSDINAIFSTHSDVCVSCKEGKGRATKEYSVVLDDGFNCSERRERPFGQGCDGESGKIQRLSFR